MARKAQELRRLAEAQQRKRESTSESQQKQAAAREYAARREAEMARRAEEDGDADDEVSQPVETELVEVKRFPTMESPDHVKVDQSFTAMISLTETLITKSVEIVQGQVDEEGRLKLKLPEQQQPWEIDVVLSASGFDFISANKGKIFLPKNGDSTPAMFELIARADEDLSADRKLYATFWFKGQYLARVQKPISIVNQSLVSVATACKKNQNRATELGAMVESAETAQLSESRSTADLTVYMRRDWDSCNPADYHITLSSPHLPTQHERVTLPEDIAEWLIPKFKQFSISGRSLPANEADDYDDEEDEYVTKDYMVGFGRQLYQEIAPSRFITTFEQLQATLGDEFKTIQIYTDEPSIPWELMVPTGSDQLLGLSHAIGRWIIPKHRSNFTVPGQHLAADKIYLVTPSYEGNLKLYSTAAESRFIGQLFEDSAELVTAKYNPVKQMLQQSNTGIIHYSGHGYAQRDEAQNVVDYGLILEDQRLKALNWRGMMVGKENASLIFFNACEVGLAERSAGFVDGWSKALTDTGSRGFISSLWELGDRGAAKFSQRFYTEIDRQLKEDSAATVAEAIRKAKLTFNRSENPTDVAYVYYGDVGLKVELGGP
jgi:hypothetical protein